MSAPHARHFDGHDRHSQLLALAEQDPVSFISQCWREVTDRLAMHEILYHLERYVVAKAPAEFLNRSHPGSGIEIKLGRKKTRHLRAKATLMLPNAAAILRACRSTQLIEHIGIGNVLIEPYVAALINVHAVIDPASDDALMLRARLCEAMIATLDVTSSTELVLAIAEAAHKRSQDAHRDRTLEAIRVNVDDVRRSTQRRPALTAQQWHGIIRFRLRSS